MGARTIRREDSMTIEGFDYKEFAESMAEQAEQLAPADLSKKDKEYLVRTMLNFTALAGEGMSNETSLKFDAEQAVFICQVLSEWTFHKVVDLTRSGIEEQHWDAIMQKIAFTLYEVAKQSIQKELPNEQILQAVEYHVVKTYKESVTELKKKNVITKEVMEKALAQSNIDTLADGANETDDNNEKFEYTKFDVQIPKQSCFDKLKEIFLPHKELKKTENELNDIRQEMQDLVNPDKMYERLGVDVISLQVGAGLLSIADPDQDGLLLAKLAPLRQRLTDDYGYIIPNVRIMDTSAIDEYEYLISVRNNVAERGYVYPGKYMVIADEWEKYHSEIPEDAMVAVDTLSGKQAYWLSEETKKQNEDEIKFVNSEDVVINHLSECVIKYVDEILTDMDVEKYIKLIDGYNPSQINYLMEYLTIYDIRRIFVNLIREKVSIKDISFVFMKLCEFVKYTTEIEVLSERLRVALSRQIYNSNADKDGILYCLNLSKKWSAKFRENIEEIKQGRCICNDMSVDVSRLVQAVGTALTDAQQKIGLLPVVVCAPDMRRQVYEFLVQHISNIVVLSTNELVHGIKVERIGKAGLE